MRIVPSSISATILASLFLLASAAQIQAQTPRLSFDKASQSVTEDATSSITITVRLSLDRAAASALPVTLAVSGTSSRPDDYDLAPASPHQWGTLPTGATSLLVEFPVGRTDLDIELELKADDRVEEIETLVLSVIHESGFTFGLTPKHSISITDVGGFRIEAVTVSGTTGLGLSRKTSTTRSWYRKMPVPDPVRFQVMNRPNNDCTGLTMTLYASNKGAVSPESFPLDAKCWVDAIWTLGDAIGRQRLTASIGNVTSDPVLARSRAPVTFALGLAMRVGKSHQTLGSIATNTSVKTVNDDTTTTTIATTGKIDKDQPETADKAAFDPWVGVSFPIWASLYPIRLSAGVSVREPLKRVYFGLNLTQLVWWVTPESTGADLSFGIRVNKIEEYTTDGCDVGQTGCNNSRLQVLPYFSLVLDGNSVISVVTGALVGLGK